MDQRSPLITGKLLRRPRNRKCRLVRDSILCGYGFGGDLLRIPNRGRVLTRPAHEKLAQRRPLQFAVRSMI
jgi:hypothetical protein